MIEFSGYLSGEAEKHFFKRNRVLGQKLVLVALITMFPFVIVLARSFDALWSIALGYGVIAVAILVLCSLLPFTKKERREMTPKRIFIEGELITSINDKTPDCRCIRDVKSVRIYEDFYELVFPFGKVSYSFMCQKNLLTQGSLRDFEQLFEGKLKDMRK